jgi:hypothetical protein
MYLYTYDIICTDLYSNKCKYVHSLIAFHLARSKICKNKLIYIFFKLELTTVRHQREAYF